MKTSKCSRAWDSNWNRDADLYPLSTLAAGPAALIHPYGQKRLQIHQPGSVIAPARARESFLPQNEKILDIFAVLIYNANVNDYTTKARQNT